MDKRKEKTTGDLSRRTRRNTEETANTEAVYDLIE